MLHEQFDESNDFTPKQLRDPAIRKRIRDTFGASALARLDAKSKNSLGSRPEEGATAQSIAETRKRPKARATGAPVGGGGSGGRGDGLTQLQRLELAAGSASLTGGLSDDLKAARAISAYYAKVAANENLKGEALFKAHLDVLSAQQNVQAIEDQIAQDRVQAAQKANAAREATAKKLKAEFDKKVKSAQKLANEYAREGNANAYLYSSVALAERGAYRIVNQALNRAGLPIGTTPKAKKAASEAPDFAKMSFEFLQNLQGTTNQYGSNFSGAVDGNGRIMTHLTRRIAESLDTVTAGQRNPEARYNRLEAESALAASF